MIFAITLLKFVHWVIGDVPKWTKNVQKGQTLKITQNHPKKTKAIDYKILLTYN